MFERNKFKWSSWIVHLERAFSIYKIEGNVKQQLLLHNMGMDTYEILEDMVAPTSPSTLNYDQIVEKLKAHLEPEVREIVENYHFHLR